MQDYQRRAMRTAHLKHETECACGRTLYGNGWRSHARSCRDWLTAHGYPLARFEREGLLANDLTSAQILDVERELGKIRLPELPAHAWSWAEYKTHVRTALDALKLLQ